MYDRAAIAAQVAKIRLEVEQQGGSTVACEDLRYLCPEEFTAHEQFMHIATIAQRNGWSFTFLPGGSVRFAAYVKA
jgi:hypothetical protein